MLSEAGCTAQQIAPISGHSLKTITVILDRYLARTRGSAHQAIFNFEKPSNCARDIFLRNTGQPSFDATWTWKTRFAKVDPDDRCLLHGCLLLWRWSCNTASVAHFDAVGRGMHPIKDPSA